MGRASTNTLTAEYPPQHTALMVERLYKPRPQDLSRAFPRDLEFHFLKVMYDSCLMISFLFSTVVGLLTFEAAKRAIAPPLLSPTLKREQPTEALRFKSHILSLFHLISLSIVGPDQL
jgi:hypothetical protein